MSNEKAPSTLLPEGWRNFKVKNVEEKTSKGGNEMLVFTLQDSEFDSCDDVYAIMTQGKRWFLKGILKACGVEVLDGDVYKFELGDLMGKYIEGRVEHYPDKYTNREGLEVEKIKHKIADFKEGIPF